MEEEYRDKKVWHVYHQLPPCPLSEHDLVHIKKKKGVERVAGY